MSLVVLATGAASAYESRLARGMQFRPLAIRSIVSVAAGGGVGIALAMQGAGVMALVAQQVVTSCLALALLVLQSGWRPRFTWRGLAIREFFADGSRVGLTGLFGFMTSHGDTVLVSVFFGSYATGIYSFAKRLTSAIYLIVGSSLLKLAIPLFAQTSGNPVALREAYVRILGISMFLMAPMLAGLSVLAQPAIGLFFGSVWAPAAPIVSLLSVMYLFLAANQVNDYLLFAVGARTAPMKRTLLQIVLLVVLGIGSSGLGLAWTAAAFVVAGVAVWPWAQWLVNRHLHSGFLRLALALKSPAIATAGMVSALLLSMHYTTVTSLTLIVLVIGGALLYFAIHWLVIRISPRSHDALKDLLQWRGVKPAA
ncbi:MAG: oligosaccharide flippase family protein [Rhodoferax sp.]|nr:oligosaccharide flippase family protein [Rhodoferax sp.]